VAVGITSYGQGTLAEPHPRPIGMCLSSAFTSTVPIFETDCRAANKPAAVHKGHNRHTQATRAACVVACARALEGDTVDYGRAKQEYNKVRKELHGDKLGSKIKTILQKRWQRFLEEGDLEDAHRSGRPPKISDEDARTASEALKAGKTYTRKQKGLEIKLITYYTSVRQATRESEAIRAVVEKYQCTAKQLYAAMKRVDPNLTMRSFAFKLTLTDKQMKDRVSFCKRMLREWALPLSELRVILHRIVQCDEGRWTYSVYSHEHQKAYIDKRTTLLHDYVLLQKICGEAQATVHFFICVSAHPAFARVNGLVYYEFTTGTTSIRRMFNIEGQTAEEAFVYQVGRLATAPKHCQMHPSPRSSAPEQ